MIDVAALGIRVEQVGVGEARTGLDTLAESGSRAERSVDSLGAASRRGAESVRTYGASLVDSTGRVTTLAEAQQRGIAILRDANGKFVSVASAQREAARAASEATVRANEYAAAMRRADPATRAVGDSAAIAAEQTRGLGSSLRSTAADVAPLNSVMSFAAGRLTAVGIAFAAWRGLAEVTRQTSEFGASLSELQAITGVTGTDLEFLTDKAKDFAATMSVSAAEAVESFKVIASAKADLLQDPEGLAEAGQAAITLSQASGEALVDMSNALATSLNQFGEGADQADRFINVLAAGAQFGAAMIGDVSESLKTAGTIAAAAGISFESTNAALQQLSQIGLVAEEAGTGLRQTLLQLETQTEARFKPSVVGLTQALRNLGEANLSTSELSALFGDRAVVAATQLIDNVDKVEQLTAAMTGTQVAHEQAAIMMDNLAGDARRLDAATQGLAVSVGSLLEPALRSTTQALTEAVNGLNDYFTVRVKIAGLPPLFPDAEVASVVEYQESVDELNSSMADAGAAVGKLAVGIQVASEILNIKLGDDIGARVDEIFQAADRRTELLNRLAAEVDGKTQTRGPTSRRYVPEDREERPDDTSELDAIRDQNAQIIATVQARYFDERQKAQANAAASLRELATAGASTQEQSQQLADTRRQILQKLDDDLAAIEQKRLAEEKKVADESVRIARTAATERRNAEREAAELARNQESARSFNASVNVELVGDDPIARAALIEEGRLAQLEAAGQRLVQQGVKSQQELDSQVSALREQSAESATLREADILRQRDARLIQLRAEGMTDEFEAARAQLDATLLMRQEAIIKEVGSVEEGMRLISDIRERGYADIAKREEEAGKRARQLQVREWTDRVSNAAQGVGAIVSIVSGGSEKAFGIQKVAAIANATINAYEAASSAYASAAKYGPAAAAVAAAAAGAAQFAQVAAIRGVSLGGGGGGSVSAGGGASVGGSSYASSGDGKTYTETQGGDAPDIATLKRSDRIEIGQLVASVNAPESIPVDGGPIPVDRPTLVIDEPVWDLPALAINTPNITAAPASMRVETPDLQIPELPVQRVLSVDERRVSTSSITATTATATEPAPAVPAPPQQRTTVLQAPSLPSLSVAQPGDIRVQAPRLPSLSVAAPAPAPTRDVSTEIRREVSDTLSRTTEATQSTSRTDSTVTAASSKETVVSQLLSATETLVSRVEAQERVTVEERTSETIRARVEAEAQPGATLARPAEVAQSLTAPAVPPAGGPLGLEFDAPVLELTEPQWQLPALTVNTPSLTAQPASVTITTPTVIIPPAAPQRVAEQGSTPQSIRGSIGVEAPGDISLRAPVLPALSVAAPRLPALEVGNVPGAIGAETPDPLQFDSPTLELTEPTWSLPALEVNTPSVRIEQQRGADSASSLAPQVAAPAGGAAPAVTVQSIRQQLQAPSPAGLAQIEAPGLPDFPTIPAPRFAVPAAPAGRTQVSTNIRVQVINNTGTAAEAEVRETTTDTETLIEVIMTRAARDIDQGGQIAQATARRFGLQQQLGYRG